MFVHQCSILFFSVLIFLSWTNSIDGQKIQHPKGNSVTYEDRSISRMINFDLKRISPSAKLNKTLPHSLPLISSSPAPLSASTASSNSSQKLSIDKQQQRSNKVPALPPTLIASYPKSVNEKIRSVQMIQPLHNDNGKFYQQIIPKLTTLILNSRPAILNSDEESVVSYRSPNAIMVNPQMLKKSIRSPLPVLPNNFAQRRSITTSKQHRSPSNRPKETIMTLSFESNDKEEIDDGEQQVYSTNESGMYVNPKTNAQFSDSELDKKFVPKEGRKGSGNLKFKNYYPQIFDTPSIHSSTNREEHHNLFKYAPRHQAINYNKKPKMTLSFADQRQSNPLSKMPNYSPARHLESDSNADWKQSVMRYAKEFGFETPTYNLDQNDDINEQFNPMSFTDSLMSNKQHQQSPKWQNYFFDDSDNNNHNHQKNDYEVNDSKQLNQPSIDIFDHQTRSMSEKMPDNQEIQQDDNIREASKDEIQDLLKRYSIELQSILNDNGKQIKSNN